LPPVSLHSSVNTDGFSHYQGVSRCKAAGPRRNTV
jgi:hypothetical protein